MKNVFLLLVAALMLCSVFDGEAAPWGDNSVLPVSDFMMFSTFIRCQCLAKRHIKLLSVIW